MTFDLLIYLEQKSKSGKTVPVTRLVTLGTFLPTLRQLTQRHTRLFLSACSKAACVVFFFVCNQIIVRTLPAGGASCVIGSQLDGSTGACCECCYSCLFLIWMCVCLSLALQEQLGAAQGKVSRRRPLPPQQGDRGVLRPGAPAAAAAQRQLAPGQGLHHEAGHQLPAHAQAARHRYAPHNNTHVLTS